MAVDWEKIKAYQETDEYKENERKQIFVMVTLPEIWRNRITKFLENKTIADVEAMMPKFLAFAKKHHNREFSKGRISTPELFDSLMDWMDRNIPYIKNPEKEKREDFSCQRFCNYYFEHSCMMYSVYHIRHVNDDPKNVFIL